MKKTILTLSVIFCLILSIPTYAAQKIQFRRGNAATWTSVNPTLAQGELGIELDTGKLKIGDGTTAWNSLDYFNLGMIYPGVGIPVSTGSAWGSSITDNHTHWDTAYGWGNHAGAGYLTTEADPVVKAVTGLVKSNGTTISAAVADTDYLTPTTAASTYAPIGAKYIVQQANGSLTDEQPLGTLATGILKNTTTTGILSIAADGTDYLAPTRIDDTKGNGDTGYVWSADKVFDQLALKQALHANLTSLAGLSYASASFVKMTNANTFALDTNTYQTTLTNSAGLANALNDETGTGLAVFNSSPSFTTPSLGVATATSINKVGFTAPSTAVTFAFGTDNATITLQGTDTYVGRTTTDTLTNKRITSRVTSISSSATPTINTDNCDAVTITALATNITSMTTNLSGTPTNFQKLIIRIKDNATARTISWGSGFEAKGVDLPTTTVASKVLTVGFIYDTVTSKWGCVASAQQ